MNILVKGLIGACNYKPINPTYTIRIFDSDIDTQKIPPLINSPLFTFVGEYIFDDVEPGDYERFKLFDIDIAKKIITDYEENRGNNADLLVHCAQGISRSPAVAMSLNDIFRLGENSLISRANFPRFNRYVYDTMIRGALDLHYKLN